MSITPVFNGSSLPYVFDYEAEVSSAWRDFPDSKNKLFFLDLCRGDNLLVYPAEDSGKAKAEWYVANHGPLWNLVDEYRKKQTSCMLPTRGSVSYLLLYTGKHAASLLSPAATLAQELAFVFDHELGHAVVPEGDAPMGRVLRAECVADAFAVIRHFQRFGADSDALSTLATGRAFYMIFKEGRWDHFTSPVVSALLAQRHDIDWQIMTPAETIAFAHKTAVTHEMEYRALISLYKDFDRYHNKLSMLEAGDDKYLRMLADRALNVATDQNMARLAAAALDFCFAGNIPALPMDDPYWQELRAPLARKHQELMNTPYALTGDVPSYSRYGNDNWPCRKKWGMGR